MSAARTAADVASLLPMDDPLAQLARLRLDAHVRASLPKGPAMTNRPGLIGTPLRDGAVDPRPTDYLGPVNAGRANPHSTHVVSTQAASPRSGNSPALEPLEDEQG